MFGSSKNLFNTTSIFAYNMGLGFLALLTFTDFSKGAPIVAASVGFYGVAAWIDRYGNS